jgi:hypothetical protein
VKGDEQRAQRLDSSQGAGSIGPAVPRPLLQVHKNLLLFGVTLALALVLAEAGLRIFLPRLEPAEAPLLFISEGPVRDEVGAIRFPPHRMVRGVLIYGNEVEADTHFQTNDLGFVDDRDYLPTATTRVQYAFVGDSYSVGLAGDRPWIPLLRDRSGIQAYSFGMGGVGVLGFERVLQSVSRQLAFSDLVIVAISDDFYRPLWQPLVRGSGYWLCPDDMPDEACAQRWSPAMHLMRYDSTIADLMAQAHDIRREMAHKQGTLRTWLRSWRLVQLARVAVAQQLRQPMRRAAFDASFEALARVRRAYPTSRIHFVHIPDRHETARGRYDIDLAALLPGAGIEYLPVLGTCPWSVQHFLPNDNHPNATGYEALAQCVTRMLGTGGSSATR